MADRVRDWWIGCSPTDGKSSNSIEHNFVADGGEELADEDGAVADCTELHMERLAKNLHKRLQASERHVSARLKTSSYADRDSTSVEDNEKAWPEVFRVESRSSLFSTKMRSSTGARSVSDIRSVRDSDMRRNRSFECLVANDGGLLKGNITGNLYDSVNSSHFFENNFNGSMSRPRTHSDCNEYEFAGVPQNTKPNSSMLRRLEPCITEASKDMDRLLSDLRLALNQDVSMVVPLYRFFSALERHDFYDARRSVEEELIFSLGQTNTSPIVDGDLKTKSGKATRSRSNSTRANTTRDTNSALDLCSRNLNPYSLTLQKVLLHFFFVEASLYRLTFLRVEKIREQVIESIKLARGGIARLTLAHILAFEIEVSKETSESPFSTSSRKRYSPRFPSSSSTPDFRHHSPSSSSEPKVSVSKDLLFRYTKYVSEGADKESLTFQSKLSGSALFLSSLDQLLAVRLKTVNIYHRLGTDSGILESPFREYERILLSQSTRRSDMVALLLDRALLEMFTVATIAEARSSIALFNLSNSVLALHRLKAHLKEFVAIESFCWGLPSEAQQLCDQPDQEETAIGFCNRALNILTAKVSLYFHSVLYRRHNKRIHLPGERLSNALSFVHMVNHFLKEFSPFSDHPEKAKEADMAKKQSCSDRADTLQQSVDYIRRVRSGSDSSSQKSSRDGLVEPLVIDSEDSKTSETYQNNRLRRAESSSVGIVSRIMDKKDLSDESKLDFSNVDNEKQSRKQHDTLDGNVSHVQSPKNDIELPCGILFVLNSQALGGSMPELWLYPENPTDERFIPQDGMIGVCENGVRAESNDKLNKGLKAGLPINGSNGYWCKLRKYVETDENGLNSLKLGLESTRQLRQSFRLSSKYKNNSVLSSCPSAGKAANEVCHDCVKSSVDEGEKTNENGSVLKKPTGLATWPVVNRFPPAFKEHMHMPNIVSLISDGFGKDQPHFEHEKDFLYIVHRLDETMYMVIVFTKHYYSRLDVDSIANFCKSFKVAMAL